MFLVPGLVTVSISSYGHATYNSKPLQTRLVKPIFDCVLMFLLDVSTFFFRIMTVLLYKKATLTYS
jgi:hypothetical protein